MNGASAPRLGVAGRMAALFQANAITPLLALVALLLGLFAVLVTPREEEPQINVTMANVIIAWPGASSQDVQAKVALPAEQVLSQIAGIEHTYSVSRPGVAVVTPSVMVIARLAWGVNVSVSVALLLAAFGSPAMVTVAVLLSVPVADATMAQDAV